jgi:hypothetical protein
MLKPYFYGARLQSDPLPERDGTLPKGQAAKENTPATGSIAPSPQAALRRYALTYTNWQATSLPVHERQLASLAVGAARLAAEQTAASQSAAAQLASNHVENKGVVLAIAPGEGLLLPVVRVLRQVGGSRHILQPPGLPRASLQPVQAQQDQQRHS